MTLTTRAILKAGHYPHCLQVVCLWFGSIKIWHRSICFLLHFYTDCKYFVCSGLVLSGWLIDSQQLTLFHWSCKIFFPDNLHDNFIISNLKGPALTAWYTEVRYTKVLLYVALFQIVTVKASAQLCFTCTITVLIVKVVKIRLWRCPNKICMKRECDWPVA